MASAGASARDRAVAPRSGRTLIEVAGLRKVYNSGEDAVEAVSSVSFTVATGQFVSILGPSGCGKSTLLMMVAGLESKTGGSIAIDAMPVDGPRPDIGVMFQDSVLLPWKTAIQNVLFPIQMRRLPVDRYAAKAAELLDFVGLAGFHHKKPHELSGGMRQRVSICRALVTDPDVLLMDEPFSALDAITRDQMNVALMDIWERYRKTALFVTHSIREAVYLADRVLVMGTRPSTVICDLEVPFARPRDLSVGETTEFNEMCGFLRRKIEHSYAERARDLAAAARKEVVNG